MGGVPDWNSTETSMMLIVDTLAHRYHQLPSYVLEHATTFDLRVNEVRAMHESRQRDIAQGKRPARAVPELTQQQMRDMIRSVKEKKR